MRPPEGFSDTPKTRTPDQCSLQKSLQLFLRKRPLSPRWSKHCLAHNCVALLEASDAVDGGRLGVNKRARRGDRAEVRGVKVALALLLQELSLLHLDDACLGEPRREPHRSWSRESRAIAPAAVQQGAHGVGRVAASPLFALMGEGEQTTRWGGPLTR